MSDAHKPEQDSTLVTSGKESVSLSQNAFKDPHDFLQTLQQNFKQLAGQPRFIGLSDLELAAGDPVLDLKVRAAASLAADHFEALANIRSEGALGKTHSDKITADDIDFALDMNDHNLSGRIMRNTAFDLGVGSVALAAGAGGVYSWLTAAPAVGTGLLAGLSAGTLEVASLCAGGGFLMLGAVIAVEAFSESQKLHDASEKDSAMFQTWLKPTNSIPPAYRTYPPAYPI